MYIDDKGAVFLLTLSDPKNHTKPNSANNQAFEKARGKIAQHAEEHPLGYMHLGRDWESFADSEMPIGTAALLRVKLDRQGLKSMGMVIAYRLSADDFRDLLSGN